MKLPFNKLCPSVSRSQDNTPSWCYTLHCVETCCSLSWRRMFPPSCWWFSPGCRSGSASPLFLPGPASVRTTAPTECPSSTLECLHLNYHVLIDLKAYTILSRRQTCPKQKMSVIRTSNEAPSWSTPSESFVQKRHKESK